jgi:hypothetical protein
MSSGLDDLDRMIASLRELTDLAKECAPQVAEEVHERIDATIAAGTDSYGVPWAPRKRDGGKALQGADKSLFVTNLGSKVLIRLTGIEAKHHWGQTKGRVARPIIPNRSDLPPLMAKAIKKVIGQKFGEIMKGRGE